MSRPPPPPARRPPHATNVDFGGSFLPPELGLGTESALVRVINQAVCGRGSHANTTSAAHIIKKIL